MFNFSSWSHKEASPVPLSCRRRCAHKGFELHLELHLEPAVPFSNPFAPPLLPFILAHRKGAVTCRPLSVPDTY